MEKIIVTEVKCKEKRIEVTYSVTSGLSLYFDNNHYIFWADYSEDISNVPRAIAIIPFVCNILPIIWITDSVLEIPVIDKSFYNSIEEFKLGYVSMYPMLAFKGKIITNSIIDCDYPVDGGNASFFSGGVDAFTTLICHHKEHPLLFTIRGADVKLDDFEGWKKVTEHTQSTSQQFALPSPIFIGSNFRLFIREDTLSDLVRTSKDGWWHGFQHGIGILSLSAPIAWLRHLNSIYIASSNTANETTTCASDPSIDNYLRFGSSFIEHDQYHMNRQQKIQTIIQFCNENSQTIEPRVCWISRGGGNCCKCEKCIRTIFAFLAENEDPARYGFHISDMDLRNSKSIVTNALFTTNDSVRGNWTYVIKRFHQTGAYKNDKRINWVYNLDPYAQPSEPSVVSKLFCKLKYHIGSFFLNK